MSDKQRDVALTALLGKAGATALTSTVLAGAAGYDKATAAVTTHNAVQKAAAAMSGTLEGQWKTLTSTVSDLWTTLGQKLMPVVITGMAFINSTAIPAIKNFVTQFENGTGAGGKFHDTQAAIGNFITGTVVPTFVNLGKKVGDVVGFFKDHDAAAKAAVVVLGGVMTAITAAWVAQGVVATINAAKTGLAWIATATASTTASTIQSKSTAQIVVGWVLMGTKAAFHAAAVALAWVGSTAGVVAAWAASRAETFAIWLLYLPEALAKAATTAAAWVGSTAGVAAAWVTAKAGMVAEWVAAAASAVAHALAVAASWVASVAGVVAAWAVTTAAVIADWVATGVAATASGIAMAAAWVVGLGPIAWVVAGIALLIGAIVAVATKTTWFQTAWEYSSHAIGAVWQWLWNSVLAPVFRFVMDGLGSILGGISNMLGALGHIPHFEWAKTAADMMRGASDQAHAIANGIKDIPHTWNVDIAFTSNYSQVQQQLLNLSNSANSLAAKGIGHALGGLIGGTGTGDTQPAMLTPGEFVVRRDGSNIADALAHFGAKATTPVGGGSGGNGDVVDAVQALGDRLDIVIRALPRTYQTMQRQYA